MSFGDTKIGDYGLADSRPCKDAFDRPLASPRTRLDAFDDTEQGQLINWGYALCDAAIRTHASQLAGNGPAPQWPCPNQALDR
jgi:NTE family protein